MACPVSGHCLLTQNQVPNLLPAHRQRLLAPIDAKAQAQALRITLLGLSAQGASARHQKVYGP